MATAVKKAALPETLGVFLPQLVADENQPRFDYKDIKGLAESIKNSGLKVALRVKRTGGKVKIGKDEVDEYMIIAGHRRLQAMQSLKGFEKTMVKVEVAPEGYDPKAENYDHITTNDGESFNLLEQADVFQRARAMGDTDAEIARAVGKSQTHVADCLLLWDEASDDLKKKIRANKIAATAVIDLLKEKQKSDVPPIEDTVAKAEAVAGGKKVTKKHIDEASGKKAAAQINNTSGKPTRVVKDEAGTTDGAATPEVKKAETPAIDRMRTLRDTLRGQDSPKKEESFLVLDTLISWLEGSVKAGALAPLFLEITE